MYSSEDNGKTLMHINGIAFSIIIVTELSTMADTRWPFNRTPLSICRCPAPFYKESQCPLVSAQTCDLDASTRKINRQGGSGMGVQKMTMAHALPADRKETGIASQTGFSRNRRS